MSKKINTHPTIAFIGAGNMASALIKGLIANDYPATQIWATGPSAEKLKRLAAETHIHTTTRNLEAATQADIIVFAVKPNATRTIADELAEIIHQRQALVISIAAGIRESFLCARLGKNSAVIRCMPNTPALVRSGMSALYANPQVTTEQKKAAEMIFSTVGCISWITHEDQLDAVTAISGCGPAYFFLLMEILQATAVELGLDPDTARQLTLQTALGSARLALETAEDPAVLRQKVASPGGSTAAALKVLEEGGARDLFQRAVLAAKNRSREIGSAKAGQ